MNLEGSFFLGKDVIRCWYGNNTYSKKYIIDGSDEGICGRKDFSANPENQGLYAEASGESFQEAVDFLAEELMREVKKSKEKENAQERRGARRAKKNATIAKAARFYRKGRIREEGI